MKLATIAILLTAASTVYAGQPAYTVTDVGKIPGTHVTVAFSINNAGQVVGWSEEMYLIDPEHGHSITNRAFLWDPVNGTQDLNALMGFEPDDFNQLSLAYALDINNTGQIVGFGTQGGWILTPVPEPGGALIALVGLWVVGISRGARRVRAPLSA